MKKQYGILQALHVAMHPAKTFIGKVSRGFDFLGFHLTPTGVTVSEAALSRHEDKVARLYEQDAKPKRIRAYRLRWLVWGMLVINAPSVSALEIGQCAIDANGGITIYTSSGTSVNEYTGNLFQPGDSCGGDGDPTVCTGRVYSRSKVCATNTPFTSLANISACDPTAAASYPAYWYMMSDVDNDNSYDATADRYCSYTVTDDTTATSVVPALPTPTGSNAQNIPIFGHAGLLAMLVGLLWFGNRRRNN